MSDNAYKCSKKGKCTIVEDNGFLYVLKEKTEGSNIKGLFTYLKSRDFNNFCDIVDDSRKEVNVYEHLHEVDMPIEQKADDLACVLSTLHTKTLHFKEVREDKFKKVYENVLSNIFYLKEYYENLYNKCFKEKYMAPSSYLFMINYYKLEGALFFCESEILKWYEMVKSEKKMRVSVVHCDPSIDHFINGKLISWEKNKVDTFVLDLVKLYQNDLMKYDFSSVYERYNDRIPLNSSERILFFVLITIPGKVVFGSSEFKNTMNMRKVLDALYKTEEFIKPNYAGSEALKSEPK